MNRIVDLFGVDIAANPDSNWDEIVAEQKCPFVGKRCFKVRKSQSEISIGTCTVRYGKQNEPVIICPNRLLERRQIFTDCLHLLTGHEPGNELHIVSEISVPGGSIDYLLVSARDRKARDFVGIELQTLDTTGTVWPERQRLMQKLGIDGDQGQIANKSYGMNWKMTAKTILMQMHHKVQTFEHVNKHLVLVVQDRFLKYMKGEFTFDHLANARTSDPAHFHSYNVEENIEGHRLKLTERLSTDTDGISVCLGLQSETNVELDQIFQKINAKISDLTLFSL